MTGVPDTGAVAKPIAELVHQTDYFYDRAVRLGPQLVRLRPVPDLRRPEPGYNLAIEPLPASVHWLWEPSGNPAARLVLAGPTAHLRLTVTLELDMTPRNPFDFLLEPEAQRAPFRYAPEAADALAAFRRPDLPGPELLALRDATAAPEETVPFVIGLARSVAERVAYTVRMDAGVWPVERTLGERLGSCRDSAWVLVQLLRLHGIAARYVSGYLVQFPNDHGEDVAELHAWTEAYLPGAGWVGLDATSGLLTAEGHVALAASVDVEGAAPLSGTVEPAGVRLEFSARVTRRG